MNGDQGGGHQGGAGPLLAKTVRVEGTNVVRVPFGVRQSRRRRPQRPDHWATLVIPFAVGGGGPTPPQAA
jgi:hypothetical protein